MPTTLIRVTLLAVVALVATTASGVSGTSLLASMREAAPTWVDTLVGSPWVYWALGASAILTEELSPILGGIAAHEGELQLGKVIVAITIGGWVATTLLYWLGRVKWEWIRRRWPGTRAAGTVALRVVARNPVTASFLVRFAFGLRIVLPIACGAARVPLAVYLPASFVGSAAWSAVFTLIGFVAGEAAVQVMGKLGRVGEIVGAVLLTAVVLLILRWNRQRAERRREKRLRRRATDR